MNAGRLAFATTRAHAARSRLLGDDALLRLRLADQPARMSAALVELALGDGTPSGAQRILLARLVDDYARLARSAPGDPEPFLALLGRHEVENLKLVYRACLRALPVERWTPWWRPLGTLAEIALDEWREVRTLPQMVERAARTRYAHAVESMARAQEPRVAESTLDAFAADRIRTAAAASEPDVAALLISVLQGQSLAKECRRAFLASPLSRAPALAVLLVEEQRLDQVIAIAEGSF